MHPDWQSRRPNDVIAACHSPWIFATYAAREFSVKNFIPRGEPRPAQMNPDDAERRLDAHLLGQIAKGDEKAFALLYDRFSPGLYAMVLKMTGDDAEAQDVLQEAFTHMWRKAGTYDSSRSAAFTWAVMVTRNKCIDRLRIRQRFARTADKAAQEAKAAPQIDEASAGAVAMQEDRARVRAALADVSDEQRQAIELAFFNDLTHEEVAARLGTPLGTVKARIRRGLLKLRELLSAAA
jgi:RNA polymerase sigma-70 factor (ECF subfamily)